MLMEYQNKETGHKIKAIHFTANSIDETVKAIADQVSSITIVYENGKYVISTTSLFGDIKVFMAKEGDYIIESDEIPDTMPQLHYFSRMSAYEFDKIFTPVSVNP